MFTGHSVSSVSLVVCDVQQVSVPRSLYKYGEVDRAWRGMVLSNIQLCLADPLICWDLLWQEFMSVPQNETLRNYIYLLAKVACVHAFQWKVLIQCMNKKRSGCSWFALVHFCCSGRCPVSGFTDIFSLMMVYGENTFWAAGVFFRCNFKSGHWA